MFYDHDKVFLFFCEQTDEFIIDIYVKKNKTEVQRINAWLSYC